MTAGEGSTEHTDCLVEGLRATEQKAKSQIKGVPPSYNRESNSPQQHEGHLRRRGVPHGGVVPESLLLFPPVAVRRLALIFAFLAFLSPSYQHFHFLAGE